MIKKGISVVQQSVSLSVTGGTITEFKSLQCSALTQELCFIPMILTDFRRGINLHDILFYYRFLKKQEYNIVHVRGAGPDGLNCILAAKLAGKGKILVTVHGMYSDLVYISSLKRWISANIIEKMSFRLADGISCVCEATDKRPVFNKYRKKMLPYVYNRMPHYNLLTHPQKRLAVRKRLGIEEGEIVALFMGRITKEKGLHILVQALGKLEPRFFDRLTVIIAGCGEYLKDLQSECRAYGDKIMFSGEVHNAEDYYAAADFFLFPSLHENHSIALLEAVAAHLPVICTDCGGNPEIIKDGVTGIVIPAYDSDSLVDAIIRMLDDDKRQCFRNAIASYDFSSFSDEAVNERLKVVYRQLLNDD